MNILATDDRLHTLPAWHTKEKNWNAHFPSDFDETRHKSIRGGSEDRRAGHVMCHRGQASLNDICSEARKYAANRSFPKIIASPRRDRTWAPRLGQPMLCRWFLLRWVELLWLFKEIAKANEHEMKEFLTSPIVLLTAFPLRAAPSNFLIMHNGNCVVCALHLCVCKSSVEKQSQITMARTKFTSPS